MHFVIMINSFFHNGTILVQTSLVLIHHYTLRNAPLKICTNCKTITMQKLR